MRTHILRGALVGAGLVWSVGAAHAAKAIDWQPSFSDAMARAKATHRLIMADFYADW